MGGRGGWIKFLLAAAVVPIVVALIQSDAFKALVDPLRSGQTVVDPQILEAAREAKRTLTGSWVAEGLGCEDARMITVDGISIMVRNANPERSLIGSYKIQSLSDARFETDDGSGITAEFWRDGDALLFQKAGQFGRFNRC